MDHVVAFIRRVDYAYVLAIPWPGWFAALMLDTAWFKWLFCAGWISMLCFQILAGGLQWEGSRRRSIIWSLVLHLLTLGLLGLSQMQQLVTNV